MFTVVTVALLLAVLDVIWVVRGAVTVVLAELLFAVFDIVGSFSP